MDVVLDWASGFRWDHGTVSAATSLVSRPPLSARLDQRQNGAADQFGEGMPRLDDDGRVGRFSLQKRQNEKWQSPYFWSTFVLIGPE